MRLSHTLTRKHRIAGAAIAVGTALATTATAFACIYMQGTFKVCGDSGTPVVPNYSTCTTSTGTSGTTHRNFTYTQTGSTSISAAAGTAQVSATGLTASHAYWIKFWDPAAATAMDKAVGFPNYCPLLGRSLGTATTDSTGAFGPKREVIGASTVGTAYVCTTDNPVTAGSNGNTAAVTMVP